MVPAFITQQINSGKDEPARFSGCTIHSDVRSMLRMVPSNSVVEPLSSRNEYLFNFFH